MKMIVCILVSAMEFMSIVDVVKSIGDGVGCGAAMVRCFTRVNNNEENLAKKTNSTAGSPVDELQACVGDITKINCNSMSSKREERKNKRKNKKKIKKGGMYVHVLPMSWIMGIR